MPYPAKSSTAPVCMPWSLLMLGVTPEPHAVRADIGCCLAVASEKSGPGGAVCLLNLAANESTIVHCKSPPAAA